MTMIGYEVDKDLLYSMGLMHRLLTPGTRRHLRWIGEKGTETGFKRATLSDEDGRRVDLDNSKVVIVGDRVQPHTHVGTRRLCSLEVFRAPSLIRRSPLQVWGVKRALRKRPAHVPWTRYLISNLSGEALTKSIYRRPKSHTSPILILMSRETQQPSRKPTTGRSLPPEGSPWASMNYTPSPYQM
jgi:hypothetical protein